MICLRSSMNVPFPADVLFQELDTSDSVRKLQFNVSKYQVERERNKDVHENSTPLLFS